MSTKTILIVSGIVVAAGVIGVVAYKTRSKWMPNSGKATEKQFNDFVDRFFKQPEQSILGVKRNELIENKNKFLTNLTSKEADELYNLMETMMKNKPSMSSGVPQEVKRLVKILETWLQKPLNLA